MASFNPGPFGGARPFPLDYGRSTPDSVVRSFFNQVYAWMCAGLATTALVAWWVSTQPQLMAKIFRGPALLILLVVELVLVGVISAAVRKINATAATLLFMLYSALNGLTLSVIFLVYTQASLASTFLVSAGVFGAMSVWGMFTKADLTRFGSLLFMALIGLVIASVVNIFFASSALYWLITYAGVLIFVGLTAYDTQKLKELAMQIGEDGAMAARYSVSGALTLYLDFINLFLLLLRLMGDRRR